MCVCECIYIHIHRCCPASYASSRRRRSPRLRQRRGKARSNQSINQNPERATHEHKRSHIPAPPRGLQTPRREATKTWGAKSESRKR